MNTHLAYFPFQTETLPESRIRLLEGRRAAAGGATTRSSDPAQRSRVANSIAKRIAANLESSWTGLCKRIDADYTQLFGSNPRADVSARWIVQESHNGQQRPAVVWVHDRFYVYKPRSLDCEIGWGDLMDWFGNLLGQKIAMRVEMVSRKNYGWCNYVAYSPCRSESEVKWFYWRMGALAALVWAVGGFDASASNIVAAGEFPALVDAEMVLQPGDNIFHKDIDFEFRGGGVVPVVTTNAEGREISIGAAARKGTRCVHSKIVERCSRCCNVPRYWDERVAFDRFENQLVAGFTSALLVLGEQRQAITERVSGIAELGAARARIAVRPTVVYTAIQKWISDWAAAVSIEPVPATLLMQVPLRMPIGTKARTRIAIAESDALLQGDIPRFEIGLQSRDVSHRGVRLLEFRYSGVARARSRIAALSRSRVDSACQRWLAAIARTRR